MSLADKLPTIQSRPAAIRCLTCMWLETQPQRDRDAFDELFDRYLRKTISKSYFLELCKEEGLVCEETSFSRHLKRHHGSG